MTLQSADRFINHAVASERVLRAVDNLDETIKIIRSAIFGLRLSGINGPDNAPASRSLTVLDRHAGDPTEHRRRRQ
ncbi:hypothetical protein ACIGXF_29315 [Streptomyces sp. NPDC053086]|uniref:hypothetical protein n=1 Tax=unclassified Streptomyces TaxID=2593676 RepID=UPI0037D10B16